MRRVLISSVLLLFALVAAHQATAQPQTAGGGVLTGFFFVHDYYHIQ
jgi:hypothetical protein